MRRSKQESEQGFRGLQLDQVGTNVLSLVFMHTQCFSHKCKIARADLLCNKSSLCPGRSAALQINEFMLGFSAVGAAAGWLQELGHIHIFQLPSSLLPPSFPAAP